MSSIQKGLSIFLFTLLLVLVPFLFSADRADAQSCAVNVIKNAVPADNTVFNFSFTTVGFTEEFQLSDPDNNSFNIALGNEATITENLPTGWALASIECEANQGSEGLISFSVIGSTVTVNCSELTFVQGSCIFNNVIATRDVPTLSQWGLIAMAGVLGLIGFIVVRRRKLAA